MENVAYYHEISTFYTLKSALLPNNPKRIFAVDNTRPGAVKGSKRFLRSSPRNMYNYLKLMKKLPAYEMIIAENGFNTRLYLDVEIDRVQDAAILDELRVSELEREFDVHNYRGVVTSPFLEADALLLLATLRHTLIKFVKGFFGLVIVENDILVLQACSQDKLSFHITIPSITFHSHNTSMVFTVWEYSRRLYDWLYKQVKREALNGRKKSLFLRYNCSLFISIRAMKAHQSHARSWGPIDIAPYSKNQAFRMAGCGKGDAINYARKCLRPAEVRPLVQDLQPTVDFEELFPNYASWCRYLVRGGEDDRIYYVTPANFPYPTALRAYATQNDPYVRPCSVKDTYIRAIPHEEGKAIPDPRKWFKYDASNHAKTTMMMDDVSIWKAEDGQEYCMADLLPGMYVYHDSCEDPIGRPSALVGLSYKESTPMIHCFMCSKTIFMEFTYKEVYVGFLPTERKRLPDDVKYLNQNPEELDVQFDTYHKWLVIDAGTGTGKTQQIDMYLRTLPEDTRIVSINSRTGNFFVSNINIIALALSLGRRLRLTSYKDYGDDGIPSRLSCTLDHLVCLRDLKYDVVILDENGMTMDHTVSTTIAPRIGLVLNVLKSLLVNAKKVILSQHLMLEVEALFFTELAGEDLYGDNVLRVKVDSKLNLHPIRRLKTEGTFLYELTTWFSKLYDADTKTLKRTDEGAGPMLILTTRKETCKVLAKYLQRLTDAPDRIKYITAETQGNAWNKAFMEDPNSDMVAGKSLHMLMLQDECDVMIMTHCAPAGLSVCRHFTMLFLYFPRTTYMVFRSEYQFSRRLRIRDDLFSHIYAWIEDGPTIRKVAHEASISTALGRYNTEGSFVTETTVPVFTNLLTSQRDNYNRHHVLWLLFYDQHDGLIDVYTSPSYDENPDEYEREVIQYSKDFYDIAKTYLKGISKFFIPENLADAIAMHDAGRLIEQEEGLMTAEKVEAFFISNA